MLNVNIRGVKRTTPEGTRQILKEICFSLLPGNIYSITGKNGSGKTTLLKAITALSDKRFYSIEGEVIFGGKNILSLPDNELNSIRKKDIKYILQDPVSSFNPLKKLGYYFDNFNTNSGLLKSLLSEFELPAVEELTSRYVYEISGGMAQRLSIAIAISAKPSLLILDEPNSALHSDMSIVLSKILTRFVKENFSSVLITTQDLDFASGTSDQIGFLNGGFSGFMSNIEFFSGSTPHPGINEFITVYREL